MKRKRQFRLKSKSDHNAEQNHKTYYVAAILGHRETEVHSHIPAQSNLANLRRLDRSSKPSGKDIREPHMSRSSRCKINDRFTVIGIH